MASPSIFFMLSALSFTLGSDQFYTVIFSSVLLRFLRFGCKFENPLYLLFVWSYCLAVKTRCQPHLSVCFNKE